MADRQRIQGYDRLVQCGQVSSSTDASLACSLSDQFYVSVRGRPTFRRPCPAYTPRPLLEHSLRHRQVAMRGVPNSAESTNIPRNPAPMPLYGNNVEMLSTRTAMMCVALIFVGSLFLLFLVYMSFPHLTEEEKIHIRLPWSIEDAKQLGIVLDRYKDDNYFQVLGGVFVTYIFLQTFAIPGSLFLSILSGFLFPFSAALLLVCTCSAVGASLCFLLSQLLGRRLVQKYFPDRANKWAVTVHKQRDNLFNYVMFLRITPFLPNWFINLTAPVIGVPLKPFALGTFFGVAPPSFVAIQAGQTLHEMTATDSAFSWTSVTLLGVFAVVSLIPIFLKERFKEKFD